MSVQDIMLTYISASAATKELFMPCVAYIKDGKIKGRMFDSFLFLPSPNYLYNYTKEGHSLKPMQKQDWLSYIYDLEFAPGLNVNALDEAVGETNKALGEDGYKAGVFLSLFRPVEGVGEFGEVGGKNLNFSSPEDRIAGIKWFIDEQLSEFNKRNFKNIYPAGFYWFHESIDFDRDGEMLRPILDYIRSLGLKSIWAPYFKARGYDRAKENGFDLVAMQGNYFPGNPKFPNAGPLSRLDELAEIVKSLGIGVTIELSADNEPGITGVKQYLKYGVERGYMDGYHVYYINSTCKSITGLCHAEDGYFRGLYDNFHDFFKKTLKVGDIVIK